MSQFIQIITAFIGSIGFAILYNIKGKKLLICGLGGAFSWTIYLLAYHHFNDVVLALLISTISSGFLAEFLARIIKTPVIILLVPMLIPLIPGSDLYYTTQSLMLNEIDAVSHYGNLVIKEAAAIAMGIILSVCIVQIVMKFIQFSHKHSHNT